MTNEDKMLQLVLSDKTLSEFYEFDATEHSTVKEALQSENVVVVAVAKIISGISKNRDKNSYKEIYNEVFNYLNKNMI